MHQIINYLLESDTNIKKSEADNQGLMAIKWQLKEQYRLLMFNWISQQTENVMNRREPTAEY